MFCKLHCKALICAFILSTLLIIVLLSLGILTVTFQNANLTVALLGIFAIALIASESASQRDRWRQIKSVEEGSGMPCRPNFHWHHKCRMWVYIALFLFTVGLSFFIVANTLLLPLLPIWVLSFLLFAIIIDLL